MKICLLGDAGSIHIRRWCEFFKSCNDEVYLISLRNYKIDGIRVIFVENNFQINSEGGNIQYLLKLNKIRSIIKEIKPDIVNAHYLTSYGLMGALSKPKILVTSTWGSDILVTPKRNYIYKLVTQYVLRKSNLITSDAYFMSKEIENLGVEKSKILTAPMGIEPEIFNNLKRNQNMNPKNFLSMRTLNRNSNIDVILRAFSKLVNDYKDVKLTIVNDGDQKKELEELTLKLGIEDNVEFLGCVNRDKIVELLKSNDIYLSIPTSDSTSVTLLEAMACNIFPIVSSLPGNKEWIKNLYNGLIIEEINEISLYNSLKFITENTSIMKTSQQINSKIINERAVWYSNMNYIRDSYLKLIR